MQSLLYFSWFSTYVWQHTFIIHGCFFYEYSNILIWLYLGCLCDPYKTIHGLEFFPWNYFRSQSLRSFCDHLFSISLEVERSFKNQRRWFPLILFDKCFMLLILLLTSNAVTVLNILCISLLKSSFSAVFSWDKHGKGNSENCGFCNLDVQLSFLPCTFASCFSFC